MQPENETPEAAESAVEVEADKPDSDQPGDGAKKALAAERKARREAEAELARLREAEKERERAGMNEAEREKTRAAELEAELREYRTRALRSEIAADMKVPAGLSPWLRGDDEDAIRANAEELMQALNSAFVPRSAGASPEDTGAGKRGQAVERSPQELAADVMQR